jgi:hypothetical protein
MPIVSCQGLSFSGLAWIFESYQANTQRPAYGRIGRQRIRFFMFSKFVITVIYCIQLLYVL